MARSMKLLIASLLTSATSAAASNKYRHWYTYPHSSGNRILPATAHGTFPDDVAQIDVILPSNVEWIVATENGGEANFVVTTSDGRAYLIDGNGERVQLDYTAKLRDDQPPLVRTIISEDNNTTAKDTLPEIVQLPMAARVSPLSHPVPVGGEGGRKYVYIDTSGEYNYGPATSGDVVLWDEENGGVELDRLSGIDALQDGRIVISPADGTLMALYGGATAYSHCVLGDCTESSRLLLIRVDVDNNQLAIEKDIRLPNGDVFEGISPMFLPDGETIATTVANDNNGAWLQTYNLDGEVISTGPSIGWGWRHMLFYNDFGTPDDPHMSMVDVLTPHVRMILEFFDVSKPNMQLQAEGARYTTHSIGLRILDTGLSGDFNGDCINEAVVLDSSQTYIKAIQLVQSADEDSMGAVEVWSLPLPGKLSSNLAAVALSVEDGRQEVALAAASGTTVRIFLPSYLPSLQPIVNEEPTKADISSSAGMNTTIMNDTDTMDQGVNTSAAAIANTSKSGHICSTVPQTARGSSTSNADSSRARIWSLHTFLPFFATFAGSLQIYEGYV